MLFQRLARNFIKNGYFPTDSETLKRILSALVPASSGQMAIFDPTVGEGTALAECKHHLGAERTIAYGVEIDEERAWHAKNLLDHCIHGDLMDCVIGRQQFGLLFFNPPYGDLAADKSGGQAVMQGRARLEKFFYRRTIATLQNGGVIVLILPYSALDVEFAKWLTNHLRDIRVFLAPEQQFKQVVLLGIKGQSEESETIQAMRQCLIRVGAGELPEVLPEQWLDEPYAIPASKTQAIAFSISRLDAKQLSSVIQQTPCLWEQFETRFQQSFGACRRPLMDLSQWHLALALAAGQVSGVVKSNDGRSYLIRGSTYKTKVARTECQVDDEGCVTETHVLLDRFVPILRALDMTPGSERYGRVLTIR